MIHRIYYLMICIGAMVAASSPAQAANCADHSVIVQRLAAIYGETRQSRGFGPADVLVEVFAAPLTGSWTIAVTHPDGQTCLVAAGQAFHWRQPWLTALRVAA